MSDPLSMTQEQAFTAVLRLLPTAHLTPQEAGQLHERVATALDALIAAVRAESERPAPPVPASPDGTLARGILDEAIDAALRDWMAGHPLKRA